MGNKNEKITIRASKSEKERIRSIADSVGVSMSQYVISTALNKETYIQPRVDNMLFHLTKISNYVNTIPCDSNDKELLRKEVIELWRCLKK